mgnify:CR=1 FL=1
MQNPTDHRFCDIIVQLNRVLSRRSLPPELYKLAHYILMNCCIDLKTGRMLATDKQLSGGTCRAINTISAQVKALGRYDFFDIKRGAGPAKTEYTLTQSVWLEAKKEREEINQRREVTGAQNERLTGDSSPSRPGVNYPAGRAIHNKKEEKKRKSATGPQSADVTLKFRPISSAERRIARDLYDSLDFERWEIELLVPDHGGCWVPADLRSHYGRYTENDVLKLRKICVEKIAALEAQAV